MLRRGLPANRSSAAAALLTSQRRAISNFAFGHPNLTEDFTTPTPANEFRDKGIEVIQLSNGARCISHGRDGAQQSVGIYVEAGAKYDPLGAQGLSYVMRWAMPTSNFDNSLFQLDRNLRSQGCGTEHCEIDKKWIGWKLEGMAGRWEKSFHDLCTCISAPRFPESDVERFRDTMDNLLEESRWQTPREYCIDQLENVSYFREPLGNPRHVPPASNDMCGHAHLVEQWSRLCIPNRIVIAGVNISADELAASYENAPFPHTETAPHHARADTKKALIAQDDEGTQWQGGTERHEFESRPAKMCSKPDMDEETICAVGFQTYGRHSPKEFATAMVTQHVLDGIFEDGIRADRSPIHRGIRTFFKPFTTTGLVGFTARNDPDAIGAETQAAIKTVRGARSAVDERVVSAAKERAKVAFFHNELEMNRDYLDHLVKSLQKGTNYITVEQSLAAIDAVTTKDVSANFDLIMSTKPTLFATGQTHLFPSLRQMGF